MSNSEYILLEEALLVTGLAEKTLRARLRGIVPNIGHQGWFREEFFEYWKNEFTRKSQGNRDKTILKARNIGKTLALETKPCIMSSATRKSGKRSCI